MFSSSFISRIRTHWERQVSESTASSEDLPHKIPQSASKQSNLHRTSVGSGLLRGDAKLVDTSEIAGRLANQVRISNDILERLSSRSGESEKEWIQISLDIPRIDGTDHIQALRSSLSVELMVWLEIENMKFKFFCRTFRPFSSPQRPLYLVSNLEVIFSWHIVEGEL